MSTTNQDQNMKIEFLDIKTLPNPKQIRIRNIFTRIRVFLARYLAITASDICFKHGENLEAKTILVSNILVTCLREFKRKQEKLFLLFCLIYLHTNLNLFPVVIQTLKKKTEGLEEKEFQLFFTSDPNLSVSEILPSFDLLDKNSDRPNTVVID